MKDTINHRAARLLGALTLALAVLLGTRAPALAAPNTTAADKALAWIKTQQQDDGGFAGFGAGSTADVVYAIAARGQDANTYTKNGKSPLDFLAGKAADLAKTAGGAAKLALAVALGHQDPHAFGGLNLVQIINSQLDPTTGHYGKDVTGQALVILAFRNMGEALDPQAYRWLAAQQGPEGGWSFGGDKSPGAADTNTTGLVLQAFGATDHTLYDAALRDALTYFHTQQNSDGGFPYSQTDPNSNASDANSTATVIMGLLALGEDPAGAAWSKGGKSALAALEAFQNPSGAFRYQAAPADDNAGATYQAVPALLEEPLPFAIAPPNPAPGMPTTGAPDGFPLGLVALALALLAGGALFRRQAIRA